MRRVLADLYECLETHSGFTPKFIFGGGKVGHIEDVSVGKGYQRKGIGFKLVNYATEQAALIGVKTVLDRSDESMAFYQKLGYSYQDITS